MRRAAPSICILLILTFAGSASAGPLFGGVFRRHMRQPVSSPPPSTVKKPAAQTSQAPARVEAKSPSDECCTKTEAQGPKPNTSVTVHECDDVNCKVRVSGGPCKKDPKCEPLNVDPVGDLPTDDECIPAYVECKPAEADVDVPHVITVKKHYYVIERRCYKTDCCEYEICVPTKKCVDQQIECKVRKFSAKLEVCIKPGRQRADVYVLNVPGMPPKWVILANATAAAIKSELGIDVDFSG